MAAPFVERPVLWKPIYSSLGPHPLPFLYGRAAFYGCHIQPTLSTGSCRISARWLNRLPGCHLAGVSHDIYSQEFHNNSAWIFIRTPTPESFSPFLSPKSYPSTNSARLSPAHLERIRFLFSFHETPHRL